MNELSEKREIAQSEALDKTAKIVSGLIPGGASAYELFTALVTPLHVKRKEGWVREVTMRLHKLETEGKINMEELSRNEEFNTIITKATLLAQQTHQKEKIEALKNVVINSAIKLSREVIDFDEIDYFLTFIQRISPLHILIINTFENPREVVKKKKDKFSHGLKTHIIDLFITMYPELKEKKEMVMQCWKDLYNFGFVELNSMKSIKFSKRSVKKQTTDLGDRFLEMIESDE